MKMILTSVASLLLPGLGQLFHEKWGWALALFAASLFFGVVVNVAAALHCLFLSAK
jgi:hypothetical protein